MVWGVVGAKGFGRFAPEGRMEADPETGQDRWHDRLASHYWAQTPEEQRRLFDYDHLSRSSYYASYAAGKFTHECGSVHMHHPDWPPYSAIEPHEPPQFYSSRPYPALASFITFFGGTEAVDENLKAILERLEPGVHQFFPLKIIIGPNDRQTDLKYFTFRMGQYCTSFSPEQSDVEAFTGPSPVVPNYYSPVETKKGISGIALSKAAFGNAHLWRERWFPSSQVFCISDELKAEIDKEGLSIARHYKMREV